MNLNLFKAIKNDDDENENGIKFKFEFKFYVYNTGNEKYAHLVYRSRR